MTPSALLRISATGVATGSALNVPATRPRSSCGSRRKNSPSSYSWVGVQGLGDQALADLGPVGVGGVDEVDVERHGPAQCLLGPVPVGRITPDPRAGDPHRAESQP